MGEIRIQKIDGQEFVPYKDYLRLKDTAHEELSYLKEVAETVKELEQENKKLKSDLEQFSEAYKRYRDYEKEELAESCYDLERENKKLKERIKELEYLWDINEELMQENKQLKARLEEYENLPF